MGEDKKIVIIGAGPAGIEAALFAARRGFDVHLYERGEVGEHIADWGHVTLFSQWELNRSPWGEDILRERGVELSEGGFPTGREFLDEYLLPLAQSELLADRIHTHHDVLGVSREHALKGDFIANPARKDAPFLLLVRGPEGEFYTRADILIDATGSYSLHNPLGPGGLMAIGEEDASDAIVRRIPDVLGEEREAYLGARTLVIGAGYSAVTTVKQLEEIAREDEETKVFWMMRSEETPYQVIENDSLPQRAELATFGNEASMGMFERVSPLLGSHVHAITPKDSGGWRVSIQQGGKLRELEVDRIVSNVGYRPDMELTRELQVHHCYASEGPMKLAASLLAAGGGGGDCLAQTSAGVETLLSPEPDFYIIGAKSYGRNSSYLLRLGIEQIGEIAARW